MRRIAGEGQHHPRGPHRHIYQTDEENGLVQDSDVFAKGLIVERNTGNPNRVDALWPGILINQLRIFALLAQFRLSA